MTWLRPWVDAPSDRDVKDGMREGETFGQAKRRMMKECGQRVKGQKEDEGMMRISEMMEMSEQKDMKAKGMEDETRMDVTEALGEAREKLMRAAAEKVREDSERTVLAATSGFEKAYAEEVVNERLGSLRPCPFCGHAFRSECVPERDREGRTCFPVTVTCTGCGVAMRFDAWIEALNTLEKRVTDGIRDDYRKEERRVSEAISTYKDLGEPVPRTVLLQQKTIRTFLELLKLLEIPKGWDGQEEDDDERCVQTRVLHVPRPRSRHDEGRRRETRPPSGRGRHVALPRLPGRPGTPCEGCAPEEQRDIQQGGARLLPHDGE